MASAEAKVNKTEASMLAAAIVLVLFAVAVGTAVWIDRGSFPLDRE
jgi:hypothetical protein